jgi:hypothetical protein
MTAANTIWQRLSQNRAANAPAFRAARIDVERIQPLTCPSCGVEESALFWSPEGGSGKSLRLSCPICGRTHARYDLRRNRGRNPLNVGRALAWGTFAALLLLVGVLWLVRTAPPMSELRESMGRLGTQTAAAAGEVRERVDTGIRRIARAAGRSRR